MEAIKIKKSLEYKLVLANGKRINSSNFNLQYLPSEDKSIRIGITASKKLGNAVKRNYIKRRIRALFFKIFLKSSIQAKHYVIIGKKGILFEKFDSLYKELKLSFKNIEKQDNE